MRQVPGPGRQVSSRKGYQSPRLRRNWARTTTHCPRVDIPVQGQVLLTFSVFLLKSKIASSLEISSSRDIVLEHAIREAAAVIGAVVIDRYLNFGTVYSSITFGITADLI